MALYGYIEGRSDGVGVPDNIVLRCDCVDRCELEVEKQCWENEPAEYYITFKTKNRNVETGVFKSLWIKLKKMWCIIRGKDYVYYDIEVDNKAMKDFYNALGKLINKK